MEGEHYIGDLLQLEPFSSLKGKSSLGNMQVTVGSEDQVKFSALDLEIGGRMGLWVAYEPVKIMCALLDSPYRIRIGNVRKGHTIFLPYDPDDLDPHNKMMYDLFSKKYTNLYLKPYFDLHKVDMTSERFESIEIRSIDYEFMKNLFGENMKTELEGEWEGMWDSVKLETQTGLTFEFMYEDGSFKGLEYKHRKTNKFLQVPGKEIYRRISQV